MLKLLFGPELDGGTPWRWRVSEDGAAAGWAAVGPLGLADRLGLHLGIPRRLAHSGERTAAYAARLGELDDGARSYSTSAGHDAWGVAAFLLGLRDALRWEGWSGQALRGSARLRDLAELESHPADPLPRGLPDLYHEILGHLQERRALPISLEIELATPPDHLPPVVRRVLQRLEDLGAPVSAPPAEPPRAPAHTDLGRLQRALLGEPGAGTLQGDGTVALLEAETPWEAAELAAAGSEGREGERSTWVSTGERGLLDTARRRRGLPALGDAARSRWRPALQVLPLRLALAFRPRDPLRAVELLSLPCAPLPARARRRLLRALAEMPGIGSPAWEAAVERCVEEAEREADGEEGPESEAGAGGAAPAGGEGSTLRRRIEGWFGGPAFDAEEGIPPVEVVRLAGLVGGWARARAYAEEPPDPLLTEAAQVARRLERMVRRLPDRPISRIQLEELHDAALGRGAALRRPGEAGRPAVCTSPGAVTPPLDTAVWWGWLGPAHAPSPPWTPAERRALSAAGIQVPAPGEAARIASWGWRRPIVAAEKRVVLVRWRLAGGEPTVPHPLQDELAVRLGAGWAEPCRVTPESALAHGDSEVVPPAPAVRPRDLWRLPSSPLIPRRPLSPTSISTLLGCPLRWTLERVAGLRPSPLLEMSDGPRLVGDFAHRILAELVTGPAADPREIGSDAAARWCREEFDRRVEREAAPLCRPGRELELRRVRETIATAGARLVEVLREGGWRAVTVEEHVEGEFAGRPFGGRIDLLLRGRDGLGILDLKLGGGRYRREELAQGAALQLALYARAASGEAPPPPVGFFTLDEQRILTVDDGAFPGAEVVEGPGMAETLAVAEEAWRWWMRVFVEGLVPARHESFEDWQEPCAEAADAPVPDEGPAGRAAPCRWCDYRTLCTARVADGEGGPAS